jgi:polyhydroxyalkanoate synthesis regulator phasin
MKVILRQKGGDRMTRNKNIVVGVVLGVVLLTGSLVGGIALAADNGESGNADAHDVLWAKVSELYLEKTGTSLDQEALQASLKEAMEEIRGNAGEMRNGNRQMRGNGEMTRELPSLEDRLQNMVDNGRITQEQADEYLQWWNSKPDVDFGFPFGGRMTRTFSSQEDRLQSMVENGKITQEQADEYLQWWNSKPDVAFGMPFKGPGGPCVPPSE